MTVDKPDTKIVKYLLSSSSQEEIISYHKYINGDIEETAWIKKASEKREILFNVKCLECNSYINVYETGVCKCNNGHLGYNRILEEIMLTSL